MVRTSGIRRISPTSLLIFCTSARGVFAGANSPQGDNKDDGLLTADEIAFLPLNAVQLVILSACETGLGEVAGGEGVLGLQRAFQVSGAKTTISSFWSVDDDYTKLLMQEFYLNHEVKGLSKSDALRNAQLALLRKTLTTQSTEDRGDKRLTKPTPDTPDSKTLSPQFWAAFTLSGDWR
jgi:CHAT domain-containing protein